MNDEQKFLISIMSDYINSRTTKPSTVDMETVLYYSSRQQIQTVLYYQCHAYFGGEELRKNFLSTVSQAVIRNKEIERLIGIFSSNGINIAIVKGYLIEKLYSPNYIRTMGGCRFNYSS